MSKVRFLVAGVVGAVIALGITHGVGNFAAGSNSPTSYFACLTTSKTLTKVGTTPPNHCAAGGQPISWNSEEPAGPDAQSVVGTVSQPGPTETSISLTPGSYVATWDVSNSFTGRCSLDSSQSSDVTPVYGGTSAAFVTVGPSGGTLTFQCAGNGPDSPLEPTATPTSIE